MHFRGDNILALELDLPERSTFDSLDVIETATTQVAAALDAITWADQQQHMVYVHVASATGQRAFLADDVGLVQQYQQQSGHQRSPPRPGSRGRAAEPLRGGT